MVDKHSMWDFVIYLKQSTLVAEIQKRFGIKDRISGEKDDKKEKSKHLHRVLNKKNEEWISDLNNSNGFTECDNQFLEDYVIENKFWYYLFSIGTSLGDEIFYASFIPFWFWNIDGAVGRRVVSVWSIIMYIGQGLKDIIKWPRPTHPAKRLQKKWSEEYGMPSTHAMVAVSIPFSIILYTMNRYIYYTSIGIIFAVFWCSVICISRIYFGMHSVLDVIVGLIMGICLMLPIVPIVDYLDYFWISSPFSPIFLIFISAAVIYFFPHSEKWTPTRGDTTMITSVCAGIYMGAWMNLTLGNMTSYPYPPPYKIIWPNTYMLSLGVFRTIVGFMLILATRSSTKGIMTNGLSFILSTTPSNVKLKSIKKSSKDVFIELATNFATYFWVGFNTVYSIPILFRYLSIERPTFYTEI